MKFEKHVKTTGINGVIYKASNGVSLKAWLLSQRRMRRVSIRG